MRTKSSRSDHLSPKRFAIPFGAAFGAATLGLCSVFCSVGCGGSAGFVTASELPEGPRRPDGVAVDPSSEPPRAEDVAGTSKGLVTLRTPLGADQALSTVGAFFRAMVAEDADALEGLFTRDALMINPAGGAGAGSPQAALYWTQRIRRLDYTKLAGEVVYREAELEIFRSDDAFDATPHPAIRAEALAAGDVVVRVPIVTPRVGSDKLLAEEMLLWLRRDVDRFRIYRLVEEFQMP